MAKNRLFTVFQNLDNAINGNWDQSASLSQPHINSYNVGSDNSIIFKTDNKVEYAKEKLELQQDAYLKDRWIKANMDLSVQAYNGLNNLKLMYRDADLMDQFPEIGAALNIISEEASITNEKGQVISVYSKSERIKSILEDLFVNRLDIQIMAVMVIRAMCKYGNQFMLLNVDNKNGVMGWRQLPVYNVERLENGIINPYGSGGVYLPQNYNRENNNDMSTQFVWTDENNKQQPFRNWQIAHFRLINNSLMLPYGVSWLNPARRHFLMLSKMEDLMLMYRLERSIERRVYKIFVGNIDDADVYSYVNKVANYFKRAQIVDPQTGQVDLRKNILGVDEDIFIPVRTPDAPTPIDTLSSAQNLTAMDDIKYIQNKVLAALQIPKPFLNFEETSGDGKNLALMDIRFTRTINRVQQAFLMELNKIAMIHLFLLGFEEDIDNFTLSMNNPSTQAEQLQVETLAKRLGALRDAVSDPGTGIPAMSMQRALKEIMKWSDKEIKDNLEEIRLEKALAAELEKTTQIIKKTGIFDSVDRIYGEPGAEYQDEQQMQGDEEGMEGAMPGGGGGMGGMDMGGDMGDSEGLDSLGGPNEGGVVPGQEGEVPIDTAAADMGGGEAPNPMENQYFHKPVLFENKGVENKKNPHNTAKIYDKSFMLNEEFNKIISSLKDFSEINENDLEDDNEK